MSNPEKTNALTDFLARNAWALILVTASVVAQWAVFGVRLDNIEARLEADATRITALELANGQILVSIASIQKDIEYIRLKIDRIIP